MTKPTESYKHHFSPFVTDGDWSNGHLNNAWWAAYI
jgi:hypothetical protein